MEERTRGRKEEEKRRKGGQSTTGRIEGVPVHHLDRQGERGRAGSLALGIPTWPR